MLHGESSEEMFDYEATILTPKLRKEIYDALGCPSAGNMSRISNDALGHFLCRRLGTEAYISLLKSCYVENKHFSMIGLLKSMSSNIISDDILSLIEEFFEILPIEKTLAYINKNDYIVLPILFICMNMKLMNIIIKYISDVTICDRHGYNALMHACANAPSNLAQISLEKINLLLDRGIDINVKDDNNRTALIYCCIFACRRADTQNVADAIELLIFRGADVSIRSKDNKKAFDWLDNKHKFNPQLLALLEGVTRINRTKRAT